MSSFVREMLKYRSGVRIPAEEWNVSCEPAAFASNDEILAAALVMFRNRKAANAHAGKVQEAGAKETETVACPPAKMDRHWHRCMKLTPPSVPLAGFIARRHLNRLETEVLAVLLLDPLGLWESRINDVGDVLRVLCLPGSKSLKALRALAETGRLHRKKLLYYEDPDDALRDRVIRADPAIVQIVLDGSGAASCNRRFKREKDVSGLLAQLTVALQKKSDVLGDLMRGYGNRGNFEKYDRLQARLLGQCEEVLRANPSWQFSRARAQITDKKAWMVVVALMGKCLGHVRADDALFTGRGLAGALCESPARYALHLKFLKSDAFLLRQGFVRPCGGDAELLSDNAESIQETEYELTDKALTLLGIAKSGSVAARTDADMREPRIRLSDLALPPATGEAVAMALGHVRHSGKLMKDWGLRNAFAYGTGVTMLFYGPPGTGKTATAEAIAHELGRPLLVADYSKIQNCFVGQTEKNITGVFRKARQYGAVLLWDEADAMFFDRDSASQAWEVRDVNVLLQQVERFEGVCILSTNRKVTLDKALERRISAKIEFPRPDRTLRAVIWKKLLPRRMPVAKDVVLAELSTADLSGGEIKNVILNAARLACIRSEDGAVTADDFRRALRMETGERWSRSAQRPAGFRTT